MPPILDELIASMTYNAIIGMAIFYIGLLFIIFVIFPMVNSAYEKSIAKICTNILIVLMFISMLDKIAFFHRYEYYEINNHNIGLTKRLCLIHKDKKEQETITFEDIAYVTIDDVYTKGSGPHRYAVYREGFLRTKDNTLSIPIGEVDSDLYNNVVRLLFEQFEYPEKTNTIEVYKNSHLIKSINGIDIDDTVKIQQFAISEKRDKYDDKLLELFTASLDITENGILVIPDNVTQKDFMENPNLTFYCVKWNEQIQQYETYGRKDLQIEDASLFRSETGKYKLYIAGKRQLQENVSDIIEYKVQDAQITDLRIISKDTQTIRNIDIDNIEALINRVDYNEPVLTEEEKEALRIRAEMNTNNQNITNRALQNPDCDIFFNISYEKLYFYVIQDGTALPLSTEGYYNKHQREQATQLQEGQHGMIFAISDLNNNLLQSIPLKNASFDTQDVLWENLQDGDYVIQMESTVVPTLCSNSLQVTIQNHRLIRAYDFDVEGIPLLWDIQFATKNKQSES